MIRLIDLLLLEGESVWAPGTGMGTQNSIFTSKGIGRRHHNNDMRGGMGGFGSPPSEEYTLTPEEEELLKGASSLDRIAYLSYKLRNARKSRGECTKCRAKVEKNKEGINKSYCPDCLKKQNDRLKQRINKGICRSCNNPLKINKNGKFLTQCQSCLDKKLVSIKNKAIKDLVNGICYQCGKNPVAIINGEPKSRCKKCITLGSKRGYVANIKWREKQKLKNYNPDYSIEEYKNYYS